MAVLSAAQIATVLDPPLKSEGQVLFDSKGEAFTVALAGSWTTEANALSTNVNANATDAAASATASAASASASAVSAAASAGSANYVGEWSTLTGAKTIPLSASHNGGNWQLTENVADVTAEEPGVSTKWIVISTPRWSLITSATNAIVGTKYLCDTATTAAFTLTFPASANDGDSIIIKDAASNFSAANLTIGRNGLKIMGLEEDMIISTDNITVEFVYAGATLGWRI